MLLFRLFPFFHYPLLLRLLLLFFVIQLHLRKFPLYHASLFCVCAFLYGFILFLFITLLSLLCLRLFLYSFTPLTLIFASSITVATLLSFLCFFLMVPRFTLLSRPFSSIFSTLHSPSVIILMACRVYPRQAGGSWPLRKDFQGQGGRNLQHSKNMKKRKKERKIDRKRRKDSKNTWLCWWNLTSELTVNRSLK